MGVPIGHVSDSLDNVTSQLSQHLPHHSRDAHEDPRCLRTDSQTSPAESPYPNSPAARPEPRPRWSGSTPLPGPTPSAPCCPACTAPAGPACWLGHRPYPDPASLLAAADEAVYDLPPEEIAEALASEPLPALPEDTYSAAHTALNAAHAAYEAKFGHVFVLCLDGVPEDEILDRVLENIRSRLANDPEEEHTVTRDQLRLLARERLNNALRDGGL